MQASAAVGAVAPVRRQRVEHVGRAAGAAARRGQHQHPVDVVTPCWPGEGDHVVLDAADAGRRGGRRPRTGPATGASGAAAGPGPAGRGDVVEVDQPQVAAVLERVAQRRPAGVRDAHVVERGSVARVAAAGAPERGHQPAPNARRGPHARRRSRPRGSPSRGRRRRTRSGRCSGRAAGAGRRPRPACRSGARRPSGAARVPGRCGRSALSVTR